MTTSCRVRAFVAGLAFLAAAPALAAPARAAGLDKFRATPRPGVPPDVIKPNGDHRARPTSRRRSAARYFMVLDRGEGHGNDTWGTKIKDFDEPSKPAWTVP